VVKAVKHIVRTSTWRLIPASHDRDRGQTWRRPWTTCRSRSRKKSWCVREPDAHQAPARSSRRASHRALVAPRVAEVVAIARLLCPAAFVSTDTRGADRVGWRRVRGLDDFSRKALGKIERIDLRRRRQSEARRRAVLVRRGDEIVRFRSPVSGECGARTPTCSASPCWPRRARTTAAGCAWCSPASCRRTWGAADRHAGRGVYQDEVRACARTPRHPRPLAALERLRRSSSAPAMRRPRRHRGGSVG